MVVRAWEGMPSSYLGKVKWIGYTVIWGPLVDKGWRGMAEETERRELEGSRAGRASEDGGGGKRWAAYRSSALPRR